MWKLHMLHFKWKQLDVFEFILALIKEMDKQLQSILCVCLQHFLNQEIRFLYTGFAIFVHILLERLLVTLSRYARVDQGLGAVKVEGVSVENFVITIFLKIIGLSIDLLLNVQSILLLESHVEEP